MSNNTQQKSNGLSSFSATSTTQSTLPTNPISNTLSSPLAFKASSTPMFKSPESNVKPDTVKKPENGTSGLANTLTQNSSTEKNNLLDNKSNDYYANLKGLNESVSQWIKTHVDKNPFCILSPVFKDYEKHLKEIEGKKVSEKNSTESSMTFKSPTTTSSSPFGQCLTKPSETNLFGPKTTSPEKPADKSPFAASNTKPMPFGASNSSFGVPTGGFSFGGGAPFSFSNVTQPPSDKKPEENAETEDEPPKVEFTQVVEEDNIFSKKCKVFVKKEGTFADRGVGMLFLKPVSGSEKVQLIVRADTNLGNLLLNFILSEAIPLQRMGKNNVMLVCLPMPDSKPPPVPVLLRVKTSEEADELLKILEKNKK